MLRIESFRDILVEKRDGMAGGDRTAKPAMEEDPGMPRTRPSCVQCRHFRAQIINPDPDLGGILGLGTELMAAQDRSLVALLGASTAAYIAIGVLEKCFATVLTGTGSCFV
jgi:Malate:quinone oxidoreductase (Mqo)